ncbi:MULTISPECIES: hypothetical protein, partial [unclassified Pseudomonas]
WPQGRGSSSLLLGTNSKLQRNALKLHKNPRKRVFAFLAHVIPSAQSLLPRKAHMRNDIVYDCYKFLRHNSEETCE